MYKPPETEKLSPKKVTIIHFNKLKNRYKYLLYLLSFDVNIFNYIFEFLLYLTLYFIG